MITVIKQHDINLTHVIQSNDTSTYIDKCLTLLSHHVL